MPQKIQNRNDKMNVVGIIPAAGTAKRLGHLPCSKELFPVGLQLKKNDSGVYPKVASHYLLERMRFANITKAFIILRPGKWDIPAYFADGKIVDIPIAYLIMDLPFGVPYTLDHAYSFVKDSTIVFGFPDIIFQPADAFLLLLRKLSESNLEIVLGLFTAKQPNQEDMVDIDKNGFVRQIEIKPSTTNLQYTWLIAVWKTTFTQFMHNYIASDKKIRIKDWADNINKNPKELFLGDVFQAALENGFQIDTVNLSPSRYLHIGTPANLSKAVHMEL
jgi:glucose-1-phosphate thymidylyltransferase